MITKFSPIPEGFFGEEGLSSTSADHIANLAKHRYESIEAKLNGVNYVKVDAQVIGSDTKNTLSLPSFEDADTTLGMLNEVAECKGFIAFLREAIKAKDALSKEINEYVSEEMATLATPIEEDTIDADDVIAGFSVKDRERYYALEAKAATIGKFIHPGGPFAKARQQAFEASVQPTQIASPTLSRDTIIVSRTVSMSVPEIDDIMSALQREHRKVEAELNGMRNTIENACRADEQAKFEAYKAAIAEFTKKRDELSVINAETRERRRGEIKALKIVIPHRYKPLYESLI